MKYNIYDFIIVSENHKYDFMKQKVYVNKKQEPIQLYNIIKDKDKIDFDYTIEINKPVYAIILEKNNYYNNIIYKIFVPEKSKEYYIFEDQIILFNSIMDIQFI